MIAAVEIPVSWVWNGLTALGPSGAMILSAMVALIGAYLLRRIWSLPADQVGIFEILIDSVLFFAGITTFIMSFFSIGWVAFV